MSARVKEMRKRVKNGFPISSRVKVVKDFEYVLKNPISDESKKKKKKKETVVKRTYEF